MDHLLLDTTWLLLCAGLVFLMQAGFMCMESGLTRSKNNINVAIKNLSDFSVSALVFWAFGFAFMFGVTKSGWIGQTGWLYSIGRNTGWVTAVFVFQLMFCATAATILSGAVGERMRFSGYILVTLLISGLLYPVFGHWAWNGNYQGTFSGWLGMRGFVDFAGSTVVHSVGGWIALACLLVIGPRIGRFPSQGPPREFTAGNLPLSMLGVFLFWIGWLGFNGGSSFGMSPQVAGNIVKTYLAGASGALVALGIGWYLHKLPKADLLMKGSLAGLVAVTASCHVVSGASAILIGGIGGLVMLGGESLLKHFQIDDAVGAVPVHLCAGIWGTLAVALFGQPDLLQTGLDRWGQFQVQILGIVVCFVWTFGLGYLILRFFNWIHPLRVTPEQEHAGLNISEHGATTETLDLLMSMDHHAQSGDLHNRVPVEPFTEVGPIAEHYNRVLDTIHTEVQRREQIDSAFRYEAKLVSLLEQVSSAANQSSTIEEALQISLNQICLNTGWPVGHVYRRANDASHELVPSAIWYFNDPVRFETFRQVTEQTGFAPGIGLPGRVLESGKPAWIADITQDQNFPRAKLVANIGVKAGFAFPIPVRGNVEAVLEFFSENVEEPDRRLLEVMTNVGAQLGRVIQRKDDDEALKKSHDLLEHRVEKRTGELSQSNAALRQEIAERHKTEEALRENEERYRTITDNVCDMVWEANAEGQYLFVSPSHEEIAGYHPNELLSTNIFSNIHPEDLPKIMTDFDHALQAESFGQAVYRNKHKNGEWRWLETTGKTIRTSEGEIRAIGATRDITERIRAKEALKASQARLAGILDIAKDAVISIDEGQRITLFNQGAERIFGYRATDVLGQSLDILLPSHAIQAHRESVRTFAETNQVARNMGVYREVMGRRKDGSEFFAEASISKLSQNGQITCTVILRDTTERKQAEENVRQLNEELEQRVKERTAELDTKNSALETFAYSVSHDLKAPLRAIDGYSRLLVEDYAHRMDGDGLNFLKTIRRSSIQMDQLIDDLLAYSRLERQSVSMSQVNLRNMIQELLREHEDFQTQHVQLEIAIPYEFVRADTPALTQALRNLLGNAIKFTRDNPHPKIEIGGEQTDQTCQIWVRDNGVGFDMKYHDRVFEIFHRLHRAEDYPGTGIGLSLVKKAAERMGGRVWAESQPGAGATFYFELPRAS